MGRHTFRHVPNGDPLHTTILGGGERRVGPLQGVDEGKAVDHVPQPRQLDQTNVVPFRRDNRARQSGSTSTTISISTVRFPGSAAMPTADLAWCPASPKTSCMKKLNPFITWD